MNANQLINMVVRMVMRQVVGRGLNAGIDMAAKKMTKRTDDPKPPSATRLTAAKWRAARNRRCG